MRKFPWRVTGLLAATLTVIATLLVPTATAATPITVAQAIGQQNGASATVRGYVVGQPTATTTVVRSNFPSDYALALADAPGQTDTAQMVYVQITSAFRAAWGLRTNPGLLGTRIDVTGPLSAYFAHPGLTSPTAFAPAGTTPTTTVPTTTTAPTTGAPGDDYYRDAVGKTGPALKTSLNQIIRTNTKLSYDQVWNALKATDEDPANSANVILLYSGRSQSKSTNGGNGNDWNREHVWAKSHGDFGTATGPGTDLHHLRPEDVSVNADRGNKDFDLGGSPATEAPGNFTDSDSWEPRNAVKGDVARMLFYMAVRYEGGDGYVNLELNNNVGNGSAPYMGRLSVLLQWNAQDPPDTFEKRRNQVIFDSFQHNRNPFIDHPEWAASIWN
ncbi:Extracellular ribonuclease [Saccharothrix espanaensis DSM 44229]|uniref:Extracellular ribonuclease n=1 Tax=Saccharothrix espanaensis (strain ATCC 51144 / DSM 44229 / JCM 9112 / NBRC 15066 / NRRL 15764) TaxID=1179773 RepID=K0KAV1_SACES|nr:Extracellular ribonuclease [Saccharothrix espanaensis DSM 44229]